MGMMAAMLDTFTIAPCARTSLSHASCMCWVEKPTAVCTGAGMACGPEAVPKTTNRNCCRYAWVVVRTQSITLFLTSSSSAARMRVRLPAQHCIVYVRGKLLGCGQWHSVQRNKHYTCDMQLDGGQVGLLAIAMHLLRGHLE